MDITSVGILVDEKRSVLEAKLKNDDIDDFDIQDLDKADQRKDVMITFKNQIDVRYLPGKLHGILGDCATKKSTE
ncbi:MAG: hypothetical protein U9Q92_07550 [archaeon]|nr:hypothetical protein [archaeon]